MLAEYLSELRDISDWQVEIGRMTAFSHGPPLDTQFKSWEDLIGKPPENVVSRPRQGFKQEEGRFEAGNLVVRARPARVDLLYNARIEEQSEVEQFPSIGTFDSSTKILFDLVKKFLSVQTSPIGRLAFGAVLNLGVESKEQGYLQLDPYLPSVKIDPIGSRDFIYRINRPRKSESGVPDLSINRLSAWSVVFLTASQISFSSTAANIRQGPKINSCRLELDLSTSEDFKDELPKDKLETLFEELINLGKEIVVQGDIS